MTVENQFKLSWRHHTACPKVKRVYKIITDASLTRYERYRYERFPVVSDLTLTHWVLIVVIG